MRYVVIRSGAYIPITHRIDARSSMLNIRRNRRDHISSGSSLHVLCTSGPYSTTSTCTPISSISSASSAYKLYNLNHLPELYSSILFYGLTKEVLTERCPLVKILIDQTFRHVHILPVVRGVPSVIVPLSARRLLSHPCGRNQTR